MRLLAARLAVPVVLACLLAFTRFSARAQESSPPDTDAQALIVLTNVDRTSNGLPALLVDRRLMDLARERSQDMIDRGYVSHLIPPDNSTFADMLRERAVPHRLAGENLAFNTAPPERRVHLAQRDLMNSPTHREVILNPAFDHLGVGAATEESNDRIVFTALFAALLEQGPFSQPAPTTLPTPPRAPAPSPTSPNTVEGVAVPLDVQPVGLIEYLAMRTLRLYAGL